MKVFLSSLQPESVQSLVVRLDTFALASGQHNNTAKQSTEKAPGQCLLGKHNL
jgi:hypothetical protein